MVHIHRAASSSSVGVSKGFVYLLLEVPVKNVSKCVYCLATVYCSAFKGPVDALGRFSAKVNSANLTLGQTQGFCFDLFCFLKKIQCMQHVHLVSMWGTVP